MSDALGFYLDTGLPERPIRIESGPEVDEDDLDVRQLRRDRLRRRHWLLSLNGRLSARRTRGAKK